MSINAKGVIQIIGIIKFRRKKQSLRTEEVEKVSRRRRQLNLALKMDKDLDGRKGRR